MSIRICTQAMAKYSATCGTSSIAPATLRSMCLMAARVSTVTPSVRSVVTTAFRCASWHDFGDGNDRGNNYQPRRAGGYGEGGGRLRPKIERRNGDWDCPSCGAMVFANRDACYRCRTPRSGELGLGEDGGYAPGYNGRNNYAPGGVVHEKRAGDWDCPECRFHNFASRTECFKCSKPKRESDEMYGGGGNKRNDFDDFF